MKAAVGLVISFIWMVLIFMVGFIIVGQLQLHANDTGSLNGTAGTNWNSFIGYVWLAFGIAAFTPLVMVILIFAGLFGAMGGK
jgi:hypothetical protein